MPNKSCLDASEILERKAFLEFSESDVALLKKLHGHMEGKASFFVERFYGHLLAFEETRRLLKNEEVLERVKRTQTDYFERLTAGEYGEDYIKNRIRVGEVHRRIELDPKWYLGAYNKYANSSLKCNA
jgi:hypothetical protein